jgi:MoaA/NifB/PqqE/SkfB family radical SAM enzyme
MNRSREQMLAFRMTSRVLLRAARLYAGNGSHRAWSQLAYHISRRLSRKASPHLVALGLTRRCQAACDHCYAHVPAIGGPEELRTEECLSVIDQLKGLAALQVLFTGGEPLLRKDIFDLIAYAHKIGLLTRISTNGYRLTRENVTRLKQAGLNQCGVSIDYSDEDTHDRTRKLPGSYERVMQGLGYLRECGIDRKIVSCVSREKIPGELERIVELGERLEVNSVYFTIPYLSGRWADSREEVLSEKEMAYSRSLLKHPLVDMEFPTSRTMCSSYAKSYLHVSAVGDVTPCPAVPYVMGNIRQEPLADIWRRHVAMLDLESRGRCPMNSECDRKLLREHAASILEYTE